MSWNLSLQLNNLWSAVRTIQNNFTLGLASNLRINTASSTTTYGIQDCASISANHTSGTLVLTNYAGLVGFTLDSVGNINIPTNLTLGYLNSAKTLLISGLTAYTNPPSPANTISISLTTPVAFYVYAGMYVTISLTSNPVFNGRYKILNILSAYIISIENPTGILQGTTSIGGNLDYGYIGAVDLVASGTITGNQIVTATQTNSASASVALSNTSPQYQLNTYGAGATTYTLPDATTLPVGTAFQFNNNSSGGNSLVVKNYATTTLYTATVGSIIEVINLTNSTSAGTWDIHAFAPSNATWGTGTLTYSGNVTVTGATRKLSVQATHLWSGAGNLSGNLVLGSSTSGDAITAGGIFNTVVGQGSGVGLTSGNINTLLGYNSGTSMTIGVGNVALGAGAMSGTPHPTIAPSNNTAIGRDCLTANNMSGSQNIGIGFNTGRVTSGNNNTLIGQAVAVSLTTGSGNICIGYDTGNAGTVLTTGNFNTYVGYGANSLNGTSQGEVVLGQARGNGNSSVTLGCNTNLLYCSGWTSAGTLQISATGQITTVSDKRAKTDISYIPKGGHIETLMKLKPAEFKLKTDPIKEKYVGFIAQDLMEVIPNCVDGKKYEYEWEMDLDRNPIRDEDGNVKLRKDENGELIPRYKALDWNEINTRAILAIQEQQDEIVFLKAQLASLKATVDALVASTGHLVV